MPARKELPIKPWDPNTPNDVIIQGLREELGGDFERRIPAPTKAGLEKSIQALNRYQPLYNQFATGLINKVGLTLAKNSSYTNILSQFKLGEMPFGESIEEYATGLVRAYEYDPKRAYGERALFGRHDIDMQSSYHTINRENMYPLTVDHQVLKRAFLSPDGLAQFTAQVMEAPIKSDNWDEFLIMSSLFERYERNGGFFKVHVDSVAGTQDDDTIKSHALRNLRTLREYAEILPFLSEHYNAAHMPVSADRDDLILFTTPAFKAALDVNALASLFNVERAEVPYRVIVLPEERFNIEGAQAILTTKDFFVCADTFYDTTTQDNPAGRYQNYFLHHDGIYSASRFVPAILFTTGEGDVIDLTPTPVTGVADITATDVNGADVAEFQRGAGYIVGGSALTTPEGGFNNAVMFLLSGNTSPRTSLQQQGTLFIAPDEEAESLKIIAISTDDLTFRKERDFEVNGPGFREWPNPGRIEDADAAQARIASVESTDTKKTATK